MRQGVTPLPLSVRNEVLTRADFRCERCGMDASHRILDGRHIGLDFHHINGVRGGKNDTALNLRLLCKPCHAIEDRRTCPECGAEFIPGALAAHFSKHINDTVRPYIVKMRGELVGYYRDVWRNHVTGILISTPKRGSYKVKIDQFEAPQPVGFYALIHGTPRLKAIHAEIKQQAHERWVKVLLGEWLASEQKDSPLAIGNFLSRCPAEAVAVLESEVERLRQKVEGDA